MKLVVALVAVGLFQACASGANGKKLDQGGQYLQGSTGGHVIGQLDFPTPQMCARELQHGGMQHNDLTCSLTSTANTLPYKGTHIDRVLGFRHPMHFKADLGCGAYKKTVEGVTDKVTVSCD